MPRGILTLLSANLLMVLVVGQGTRAGAAAEPKPATKPEAKPATKVETKAGAKLESKPAAQPETGDMIADLLREDEQRRAKSRYAIPEGGVDVLVKFIDELQKYQPSGIEELVEYRECFPVTVKATAERILELDKDPVSLARHKAQGLLLQLTASRLRRLDSDERDQLLEDVRAHVAALPVTYEDVDLALMVTKWLEREGLEELAVSTYQKYGALIATSKDPQLAAYGEILQGSARRLRLKGQTLELTGTRLDGSKFDLAEFKNKVVLLNFWASWSATCREDVLFLRKAYERYHERGFEVVGVSLDRQREVLDRFLDQERLPWITLFEKDPTSPPPAARRYGILGVPMMFLIGRDGKVLSASVRGEDVTRYLIEQFREPTPPTPTDGKPAAGT